MKKDFCKLKYGCGNCATWKFGYMNLWSWCFLFLYYVSEEWVNNWWWGWQHRTDIGRVLTKSTKHKETIVHKHFCLSFSLLPSSFVVCLSSYTQRRHFSWKRMCTYCFLVFHRIGEYISLDLFHSVLCLFFCIICVLLTSTHLILVHSWRTGYWGIQALDGWQHCFEIQERVQSAVVRMVPSCFYC